MKSYVLAAACLATVCWPIAKAQELTGPPPDARVLQQKAIDYRAAIVSGRLVMRIVVKRDAYQPAYENIGREWTLVFRGKDVRTRCVWTRPDGGSSIYQKINAEKLYADDTDETGPVRVISTKGHMPPEDSVFHPRVIGMVTAKATTLHQYGLRQCILRDDYVPNGVQSETVGGVPTWVCSSKHKLYPQSTIRVWVAPQYDYSVIKLECDSGEGPKPRAVDRVMSEYSQYGSVWFPNRVVLTRESNSQLTNHEETVIERAEFGSVPDGEFAVKAMEIQKGRNSLLNGHRIQYWDGNAVVKYNPVATKTAEATSRWGYVVIALTLALGGIVLVWRQFTRRYAT